MWTDSHNHLQDACLAGAIPEMKAVGITRCVVNATCEADWPAVEALARQEPDFVSPAFGIHPWKAHQAEPDWEERLRELLEKHPGASIGECGLDGWVKEPDIKIQMPVFKAHLRLARELRRPVTIHCLKAWEPLFQAFEEAGIPDRFLMHSFGGSLEIARRIEAMGGYFSFSGYFLHQRKAAVLEVYRQLPLERILIETDGPSMLPPGNSVSHPLPDGMNHPANLVSIGREFAAALGMQPEAMAQVTAKNAADFFQW